VTLPVVVGLATGDDPTALQGIGLALTLVGVVLASREAAPEGEDRGVARAAIPLALQAAVGFGAYFTLSDAAADDSVLWLLLVGRATAVALVLVVLLAQRSVQAVPRLDVLAIAAIGIFDLAATGLYAVANTKGLLSIVAVIGALYPVTTVLLARFVLHERIRRLQAGGVALAFTGVAAVVAGG
jgi:drug/metabolite transporter (DMT)-like permease